jgi:hypothetical protein
VLCTKNGEQVIEENHNQAHGSKRVMKHAACISSNRQRAWGTKDRRMAKQCVAGAMQGVRNKDLKELHVGSRNEEGIESQACMEHNLFKGGGRIERYTQTRNEISPGGRRSPGQVTKDRGGCEIST